MQKIMVSKFLTMKATIFDTHGSMEQGAPILIVKFCKKKLPQIGMPLNTCSNII